MRNFQDTLKTRKRYFISAFSVCMTVSLSTFAGFVFLQETHSSVHVEKKWNGDFQGQLFFSHAKQILVELP